MTLQLPHPVRVKQHIVASLGMYWRSGFHEVENLPISRRPLNAPIVPLKLESIALPSWASDCGVDGKILVPIEALDVGSRDWRSTDWWLAAFLLLEGWHERSVEIQNGPIHSYSFRLKNWDTRAWGNAWVNHIAMFLRRWTSHATGIPENSLLGDLPESNLIMTHDVDALAKTPQIRVKQGLFKAYNILRQRRHEPHSSRFRSMRELRKFLFCNDEWNYIAEVIQLVEQRGIVSIFNFHFRGTQLRAPTSWLLDPSYRREGASTQKALSQVKAAGCLIGLHPSVGSWKSPLKIRDQRIGLEREAGMQVGVVRQHWLKFSWEATWSCQSRAGLSSDYTLMFNDRPGFRNSAALSWKPWCSISQKPHAITATPTILMDSHFYDYQYNDDASRQRKMSEFISECKAVRGSAALLWHPHSLSSDYGWRSGFVALLDLIAR